MPTQIQLRRGTAAEWTAANPVLAEGELGYETNTNLYKIGNGTSAWNSLSYRELSQSLGNTIMTAQSSEPATPSAGNLSFYARDIGGRVLPKFKGPSGLTATLQPAFFGNGITAALPGSGTAMSVIGGPAVAAQGTVSHPTLATSSLRQQMNRAQVLSAATANSASEVRFGAPRVWRGDGANLGGFFCRFRFSIVSTTALQRTFVGLQVTNSNLGTTQDPVALTQCVGVGNASGDSNLQILTNDGAGNCPKVDLGSSFPSQGVDDIYDLTLFAAPNASSISWRMERAVTPAVATGTLTGSELPGAGQFLVPRAYMNNGGTTAAVQFDLAHIYVETDY